MIRLVRLETYNHRNLVNTVWNFPHKHIFFVGNNGQGKTNLLEAIYCVFRGGSFRTHSLSQLCAHGTQTMWLRGHYAGESYERSILYAYDKGKRRIELDNGVLQSRMQLMEEYPCVPFVSSDIQMVTGSPEEKRKYLNQTMVIADLAMVQALSRFHALLKQRNAVLKKKELALLPSVTTEYIRAGLIIQKARQSVIARYAGEMNELVNALSNGECNLAMEYAPSWSDATHETVSAQLHAEQEKELYFQSTQSGPHRDSYRLSLDGVPVAACASMGQERIIALVLRMIQARIYNDNYKKYPIYLFDDVLLEIDESKKKHFVEYLPDYAQAFFTFLPSESLSFFHSDDEIRYHIEGGMHR